MKMTQENMTRFEDMVRNFANENNLYVRITQEFDKNRSHVEFKLLEQNCSIPTVIYWDTKKSLTDACTVLFTHLTREWNLDGAGALSAVPEIKNVIFNDPATIVIWEDGTKTVVKCQEYDRYSKETGLALCIAKKSLGNMGNFNNVFKKWIPEEKSEENENLMFEPLMTESFVGQSKKLKDVFCSAVHETVNDFLKNMRTDYRRG